MIMIVAFMVTLTVTLIAYCSFGLAIAHYKYIIGCITAFSWYNLLPSA